MSAIITVEKLGKKYVLRHQTSRQSYVALRDVIADKVTHVGKRFISAFRSNREPSPEKEEFWALKDVSFSVKQGERIGIIGRNGAGKSTLLKILSRITEPTIGEIRIRGRLASLLEVGTGFHPELTGRENIFLNGTILGMGRQEIRQKFDEIVAFAEIAKFLDTPVKRYSSGMYVRLAFAVAAHLNPEILIVDEVLAVGDALFQKKCLGKMEEIGKEGRTILFVSHNMTAISRLCNRTVLLKEGKLIENGLPAKVIAHYLNESKNNNHYFCQQSDINIPICLLEAAVLSKESNSVDLFPRHKPVTIYVKYVINHEIKAVHLYSSILTGDGTVVLGTGDADFDQRRYEIRRRGTYECEFTIPENLLNVGKYTVDISMGIPFQVSCQSNKNILSFEIVDIEQSERFIHRRRAGILLIDIPWNYISAEPWT